MFHFTKTNRRNALAVRLFISKAMHTLPLNQKHFFGQRAHCILPLSVHPERGSTA